MKPGWSPDTFLIADFIIMMRRNNPWAILFAASLVADITGIVTYNDMLQLIAKPLLIFLLIGYFYSETKGISSGLKKWIFLALIFSWIGDVLLLFQARQEIFFLLGLSAFLLAHIFYSIFFHTVRIKEGIPSKVFTLVIVAVYYTALIVFLSPWLGNMKLPVRVYGVVISFMFMLAMHMLYLNNKKAGLSMVVGALLFVISDSVLAIDKFYQSFELAGPVVMLTYGLAQWLITVGVVQYLQEKR